MFVIQKNDRRHWVGAPRRRVLLASTVLLWGLAFFPIGCGDDDSGSSGPDGGLDAALPDAVGTDAADFDAGPDAQQEIDGAATDGAVQTDGGGDPDGSTGYQLRIYVEGDMTPKTFTDGYSGQTPTDYYMGISRFDIMTSETDPNPVTVFDYGENYMEVDMSQNTEVGSVALADIPFNFYSHGRVLLKMTRFDVETTVHATMPPADLPGTVTVVAALSDALIDNVQRSQDWVQYTFNVMGGITTTGTLPELPSTGGGTVVKENGRLWLVFPLTGGLTIDPLPTQDHSATIIYEIYESFRWQDEQETNYTDDVFDSNADGSTEPVMNFGATGYQINVQ
jgi:hypothetical protein